MPLLTLLAEQYLEFRFGFMGVLGAALLVTGLKLGDEHCVTAGALLLIVLMVGASL
ncbi:MULTISPECIES: hypothetical protein [unclassified Streptomyces]|uniref:hypothetical protein n=1 Tax=unclassified Streptomyces TaxID=2593676 RepID=UPI0016509A93|nr:MULTISPECIES: hypothetical protein [unclassified Streptomyces]MDX3431918.1 hypothetical protein [Streptomyces sp. ME01-18a]WSS63342.1 hypothetical protein OG284_19975 [Streptomyces sp. NBC_01177]